MILILVDLCEYIITSGMWELTKIIINHTMSSPYFTKEKHHIIPTRYHGHVVMYMHALLTYKLLIQKESQFGISNSTFPNSDVAG